MKIQFLLFLFSSKILLSKSNENEYDENYPMDEEAVVPDYYDGDYESVDYLVPEDIAANVCTLPENLGFSDKILSCILQQFK